MSYVEILAVIVFWGIALFVGLLVLLAGLNLVWTLPLWLIGKLLERKSSVTSYAIKKWYEKSYGD